MKDESKKVYKLIDQDGLLQECGNEKLISFGKEQLYRGYLNELGSLIIGDEGECEYFTERELEDYFEDVTAYQEIEERPMEKELYWDGEQTLEVGMIVKSKGEDFIVKLISDSGDEVVLDMKCSGLQVCNIKYLKQATKSHKEETFEEVLSAWKAQGLDFAHDISKSEYSIESVFNIVYNVMNTKGEK